MFKSLLSRINHPAFFILALLLCFGQSAHADWMKKIEYKEVDGENLTLHTVYPPGHQPTDKRPAIVFFFGGGWVGGNPGQFYPYITELSKEGIVAISAQYRTKKSHEASPVDCVKDGKSAIRYVREHAAELGIDPEKIIAGGGSAGGHVAACTVIEAAPEETDENLSVSSRPQALVLLNPVISVSPNGGYRNDYVVKFLPNWQTISPLESVDASFPPTLVMVGTADKILPVHMSKQFEQKMKDAGNRCEIVFYEGMGHGFFNKPEYRAKTVEEIKTFLRSLGYLQ